MPSEVNVREELPRNPGGKVIKTQLRNRLGQLSPIHTTTSHASKEQTMKRNIRLGAAVLAAGLALTGCSMGNGGTDSNAEETTQTKGDSQTTTTSVKDLRIGLVAVNLNSPSIASIKDAFVEAAKAKGWSRRRLRRTGRPGCDQQRGFGLHLPRLRRDCQQLLA